MVVTGLIDDAPAMIHLFEDAADLEDAAIVHDSLKQELASRGAEIVSDLSSGATPAAGVPTLSQRELEVLRLMSLGWETLQIASYLGISRHTVRNHIRNLRQKLGARTKLEAVVISIRLGILPPGGTNPRGKKETHQNSSG
jgi:DNA-binding CsgD family transcriptional regulator